MTKKPLKTTPKTTQMEEKTMNNDEIDYIPTTEERTSTKNGRTGLVPVTK